ncbi:MAG: hypothetical protein RJA70_4409 [Pseudomonadota bacterium]
MKESTSFKELAAALATGVLFGVGLSVSGMTQPSKVVGFLDFFGDWDPSLGLVMAAAVAVHAVGRRVASGRAAPILGGHFRLPDREGIDGRLLIGSVIFGAGWGLGGICPGPALTALPGAQWQMWLFVLAMTAGVLAFQLFDFLTRRQRASAAALAEKVK